MAEKKARDKARKDQERAAEAADERRAQQVNTHHIGQLGGGGGGFGVSKLRGCWNLRGLIAVDLGEMNTWQLKRHQCSDITRQASTGILQHGQVWGDALHADALTQQPESAARLCGHLSRKRWSRLQSDVPMPEPTEVFLFVLQQS